MATGERQSRRELLETIETQKETLAKYETRLRDVVRAYKGLAKEKEALEKSLSALNSQKEEVEAVGAEDGDKVKSGDQSDNESIASSANDEAQSGDSSFL
jgi:hypothetical protein